MTSSDYPWFLGGVIAFAAGLSAISNGMACISVGELHIGSMGIIIGSSCTIFAGVAIPLMVTGGNL